VTAGVSNVFFTMTLGFVVVYSSEVLRGSATVYGVLLAIVSLGFAPGALAVSRFGAIRWAGKAWIAGCAVSGAATLGFVYFPDALAAYLCAFSIGSVLGFTNTTWLTTVQLNVPGEMQGRYFGVDQLGSFATIPLGQILGGYIIGVYSVQFLYTLSGAGMLALSFACLFSPSLRGWGYTQSSPRADVTAAAAAASP